ncbi:hypothetical protein E8E14_009829 [Neopestalotiopsis sp. 37M]|nr:hypothetical protein E8E14_009829 [Neopestalotiopsis sp. 37M]
MDGLSSVAVVGQLIGQAIDIWQQIDLARQTIKAAPKLLRSLTAQSDNLLDLLRNIQNSAELHTPAIHSRIEYIYSISQELQHILERLALLNCKVIIRQILHVLTHRTRDESRLNDVLSRIEKAKSELLITMNLVHVEKTGQLSERLRRIESNTRRDSFDFSPQITVDRNRTEGTAGQNSAIAGLEDCKVPFAASITDNTALGQSSQNNLILCGPGSMALLQAVLLEV